MSALTYALEALNAIPALVSAGIDVVTFVKQTSEDIKKMQDEDRNPTDAEWEALNGIIEDLRSQRPDVG